MKSIDLMIGDYICLDGDVDYDYPIQVQQIRCDDEIVADNDVWDVKDVHPIPLTKEILLNSGFSGENYGSGVVGIEKESTETEDAYKVVRYVDNFWVIKCGGDLVRMYIPNVHQLQHILKLCLINMEIVL